ncbi:glutamate formimidoyltransferase [Candidatus Acetothermia bacterium]|nr:glutamate formimidoyltransferase [Candidatus Acetothermia bacterium]
MMWNKLIESVPNISEGRRRSVIDEIVAATDGEGIRVIDLHSDPAYNRSVITIVGRPELIKAGIIRLVDRAVQLIDLNKHTGEHPRMGAVDVIPFIPVKGTTIEECISLSCDVGQEIAERFSIPVYLYERSATSIKRSDLATIRRGEFEGFAKKILLPEWSPDFGERRVHPTAGVTAVGARQFLVAYNINLATTDIKIAQQIAAAVRHRNGGLRFVKALGFSLADRGIVQVSMNLTDFTKTPIHRVFDMVAREAERHGVMVVGSEIAGTIPRSALIAAAEYYLRMTGFSKSLILEERIEEALSEDS